MSSLCCCFAATPPTDAWISNKSHKKYAVLLDQHKNKAPNTFQTNLFDAPSQDFKTCIITALFPWCMAYKFRLAVLEEYGHGLRDFKCCQGHVDICCCNLGNIFNGHRSGLILESMCCDTLSLSYSRIYMMQKKKIHPDPIDFQIIRFNNALQIFTCCIKFLAKFAGGFTDALEYVPCALDIFSVLVERVLSGCVGAQINIELEHSKLNPLPKEVKAEDVVVTTIDLSTLEMENIETQPPQTSQISVDTVYSNNIQQQNMQQNNAIYQNNQFMNQNNQFQNNQFMAQNMNLGVQQQQFGMVGGMQPSVFGGGGAVGGADLSNMLQMATQLQGQNMIQGQNMMQGQGGLPNNMMQR